MGRVFHLTGWTHVTFELSESHSPLGRLTESWQRWVKSSQRGVQMARFHPRLTLLNLQRQVSADCEGLTHLLTLTSAVQAYDLPQPQPESESQESAETCRNPLRDSVWIHESCSRAAILILRPRAMLGSMGLFLEEGLGSTIP